MPIPTREALVFGVYRDQIEFLHARSLELAASQPPDAALHAWMRSFVAYAAVKRGMIALLKSMMQTNGTVFEDTRRLVNSAAQLLLDNAIAAGTIRTGIGAPELLRALGGICMATDEPGVDATAVALVDIVFDGLRFGAAGSPPT